LSARIKIITNITGFFSESTFDIDLTYAHLSECIKLIESSQTAELSISNESNHHKQQNYAYQTNPMAGDRVPKCAKRIESRQTAELRFPNESFETSSPSITLLASAFEITGHSLQTRSFRVASIGRLSHFIVEISSFPLGVNEKYIERLSEALNVRFTNCFFSSEAITFDVFDGVRPNSSPNSPAESLAVFFSEQRVIPSFRQMP
jgi:hypothetical protein